MIIIQCVYVLSNEMFYVWKDIIMKIKPPKLVERVEELDIYKE